MINFRLNPRRLTVCLLTGVCLLLAAFAAGCTPSDTDRPDGKLQIVAVSFPAYDLARSVAGDRAEVTMLLPTGAESHAYEPTLNDIRAIKYSDLFICTGGASDAWVEDTLASLTSAPETVVMMDCVTAVEEQTLSGMEPEDEPEENGPEYDEHVWTSPKNAIRIAAAIADRLAAIDPDGAEEYRKRQDEFRRQAEELDTAFCDLFAATSKVLIFGDRFPFRYFADEYGLTCYAAFPGCSRETEPSLATMDFLANKVHETGVTTVFYIEFSNRRIADKLSTLTGAKTALLYSCQSVSAEDLAGGETYLSLMNKNLSTLKEALTPCP